MRGSQSCVKMLRESVVLLCLLLGARASDQLYLVNQLMDDSLATLAERVQNSGDVTARLGDLEAGDWTIRNARLADISSLSRSGDSWMWSEGEVIRVNGSFQLKAMFLLGDRLDGPQRARFPEPLFTVRENKFDFQLSIELDSQSGCRASYSLWLPLLKEVTYYSVYEERGLDASELMEENRAVVEGRILPAMSALIQDHSDMCESRRLNRIEMIKYNVQHEAQLFLEQADLTTISEIINNKLG